MHEKQDLSLYHYGVLGMKWGVRKDRRASGRRFSRKKKEPPVYNEKYRTQQRNLDKARIGSSGVKRVNQLLNEGLPYKRAYQKASGERIVKSLLIGAGAITVGQIVASQFSGAAAYKRMYRGWSKMAKQAKKGQSAANDVLQLMGSDKYIWLDPSQYKVL